MLTDVACLSVFFLFTLGKMGLSQSSPCGVGRLRHGTRHVVWILNRIQIHLRARTDQAHDNVAGFVAAQQPPTLSGISLRGVGEDGMKRLLS